MFAARPLSLTLRIGIVFAFSAALVIGVLGHFLYWYLERDLARQTRLSLAGHVGLVRHFVANVESGEQTAIDRHFVHYLALALGDKQLRVTIYDAAGKLLMALHGEAVPVAAAPPPAENGREPDEFWNWVSPGEQTHFQTAAAWAMTPSGERRLAVLAYDMSAYRALGESFHRMTLISMFIASVVAAGLGFALTHRVLRPVREIAATTNRISTHQLKQRLHLDAAPHELKQVATAFNRMLDRLEESFSRASQFSSDLAHELSTPIHNLMVQTQVILSRSRSPDEYRSVLESNAEEYERLSQMIEQMLFLAYADSAPADIERQELDGRQEIERLREFFEPVAEERQIRIECVGEGAVYANTVLFRRALSNLISNAVRHSPNGGKVMIAIDRRATGETELKVANTGSGIPAEHLSKIFDRFYRVETAREQSVGGSGLGLAIVKSIMDLHRGTALAQSTPDSTIFILTFAPAHRHMRSGAS